MTKVSITQEKHIEEGIAKGLAHFDLLIWNRWCETKSWRLTQRNVGGQHGPNRRDAARPGPIGTILRRGFARSPLGGGEGGCIMEGV